MTHTNPVQSSNSGSSSSRPFIASYDLGYEYSQDHYLALQCMMEDAAEAATFAHHPSREEVAA
ncbi:MAG: hypothetical protein ABR874_21940 [Candidatus Sulfotelmatobacter sp.]|jgi:hypothetical protein